jgi:photosynthetic reaction center cytochrome c subunit
VEHANEKDDKKEKQTARKMITMTLAINHDNFDGHVEVTCMSCHHGGTRPVAIPVIAENEPPEEPPAPKPADLPAADAVVDKYIQALGGAEAIAKIQTRVQKGKLTGFGPDPVPVDISAKAPDKRITTVHGQRGENITAFDGTSGWLGNSGRPPRDMSPTESEASRLDATLLFSSDLKRLFKEFKVVAVEKIDGKDAVKVAAMSEGRPPSILWFDAQSGLLVRLMRYAQTPVGRNPTEVDYADYRAADGVKVPYRWTVARPSGRFTIQVDESQQNVPVDDKTFAKASPGAPS